MDRELSQLLDDASIDLEALVSRGSSVWIFGSRASSCAREDSDWDLLIVDNGVIDLVRQRTSKRSRLDLVFIDSAVFEHWCGSELASHVAKYGHALSASRKIIARPVEAAGQKQRVVKERAILLERLWTLLPPAQQARELDRIRRDAQRAWHLVNGLGVPPTAFLDDQWAVLVDAEKRAVLTSCALLAHTDSHGSKAAKAILDSSPILDRR
jgi:predicted nucleotidyltransferase